MITQGMPLDQFSAQFSGAVKELLTRQKHMSEQYSQQGKQLLRNIEKTDELRNFNAVLAALDEFHSWMNSRLGLIIQLTTRLSPKKLQVQYLKVHKLEKSALIDILKLDVSRSKQIIDEFSKFKSHINGVWVKEVREYQILMQVCQDSDLDYRTLLEQILRIPNQPSILIKHFRQQMKPRQFIYEFFLKYAKKKVISFELSIYLCEQIRTMTETLQQNIGGQINALQNDERLRNDQHLIEMQKALSYHCDVHNEMKTILNITKTALDVIFEPLKEKYATYVQIVIEMQRALQQTHFHDVLLEQSSIKLGKIIQGNVLRDLNFNNYMVDLVNYASHQFCRLNGYLNNNFEVAIVNFNILDQENNAMLKNGEQKWNTMLEQQKLLNMQQQDEYRSALLERKFNYINDPNRFHNDPSAIHCQPILLPVSTKEYFMLFLKCDDNNFFTQFKIQVLKEIVTKTTKLNPPPPKQYQSDECEDIKGLIEQTQACKRVTSFKQLQKDTINIFTSEYIDCKQEEYIFFINDKEIMVEQEIFSSSMIGNDYYTIRKYMYITQIDELHCQLKFGYFKYSSGFSVFSIFDFKSIDIEKQIWEQQMQPAIIKYAQNFDDQRVGLLEQRKKQFILKRNIDYFLQEPNQDFLQSISHLKLNIPINTTDWKLTKVIKSDWLMKVLFLLALLYIYTQRQ